MATALRRHAARLSSALARVGSTASATQQQLVIPAEVAMLVSQRAPGLAVMPPDVVAAVDQAAADSNRKAVKRRGQELSYRLRHLSRSKHRGGVHPNLAQQLAADNVEEAEAATAARRQRRGKRRQSRHHVLQQLMRTATVPVDVEERKAPHLEQLLAPLWGMVSAEEAAEAAVARELEAARSSIADGGSQYDTLAALAYAAARMPACYAALEASLREVAARRPGWYPTTMLDFGAGPGTSVWAAQQVWRQQALDALAVEPAGAMSWLGSEIQQCQREQYKAAIQRAAAGSNSSRNAEEQQHGPATAAADELQEDNSEEEEEALPAPPPRLRWMYKLPPRYRAAQGRQYDLVTVGYVLGELGGDVERRRLVAELWERTAQGGVLVLVEPGTPSGSGHIQKARTQLLEAAHKQMQHREQQQGQQEQQQRQHAGAHVVAPCPHDGACPLKTRSAWCHFVQRFQRTQLQRNAKASMGIRPRTYQDERYSYVAIAKVPRPAVHEEARQPLIAGSFWPDLNDPQDAFLHMPDDLVPRKVPEDAVPIKRYSESEEEDEEELEGWWAAEEGNEDKEGINREENGQENSRDSSSEGGYSSDSSSVVESSSSSSSEESSSDSESDTEGEEEGLLGTSDGTQQHRQLRAANRGWDQHVMEGVVDEATRRLLLESILEGTADDDEDGTNAALAVQLQQEMALPAAPWRRAAPGGLEVGPGRLPAAPVLAPVSEATANLLLDGEHVDWEEQEPEAVAAALHASGGWSRVIRMPRKRSGHVLLDVCSVAPVPSDGGSGSGSGSRQLRQEGVLLRQVVSKAAARREAGGTAAYRLARRLRWGDLWPRHYQQRFKADAAPGEPEL